MKTTENRRLGRATNLGESRSDLRVTRSGSARAALQVGRVALALALACGGSAPPAASGSSASWQPGVTRYRLLLHDNPVDRGQALRCYGACQAQATPESYLQCLAECPGFEQTPGIACTPDEVPPRAVCFTARPLASGSEPAHSGIVVAVIANVPVSVGLAEVCATQTSPCSYTGAGLVP